jgi:hypothetical protein
MAKVIVDLVYPSIVSSQVRTLVPSRRSAQVACGSWSGISMRYAEPPMHALRDLIGFASDTEVVGEVATDRRGGRGLRQSAPPRVWGSTSAARSW